MASPVPAVRPLVHALDRALCADPRLAELPGRFLFAIDSGPGDVIAAADVCATGSTISFGRPALLADDVVAGLIAAAHAFLDERAAQGSTAWRIRELQDGPSRVAARTAKALGVRVTPGTAPRRDPAAPPIGLVQQPDARWAAGALVPLGRLSPAQLTVLATAERLVVTPWRGLLLPDLDASAAETWLARLAEAGLETTPGSRWAGVTTCAGRPGCSKALADIRADAETVTRADAETASRAGIETASGADDGPGRGAGDGPSRGTGDGPGHGTGDGPGHGLPVHWIGCARGCGSPTGAHVRVEATGTGYAVTAPGFDRHAGAGEVAALVAAARRKN